MIIIAGVTYNRIEVQKMFCDGNVILKEILVINLFARLLKPSFLFSQHRTKLTLNSLIKVSTKSLLLAQQRHKNPS